MKKIFKKSLAIMVSAAICLTALIGCLSVSAATRGEGTFTVGSVSGKPGASVTVPIELAYTSSNDEDGMGIAASLFDVSYNTNALTITDIAAGEDATYVPNLGDVQGGGDVPPQDIYTVDYRSNGETISVVDDAVRILAMPAYNETVPADSETVLTSMTVNLTFTINEGAAAQDYAITITEQQTCDYGQATPDEFGGFTYADDEEFIEMSITDGKVTVTEDHVHAYGDFQYKIDENNYCITYKTCECGDIQVIAKVANKTINKAPVLTSGLAIAFRMQVAFTDTYTNIYAEFAKDVYEGNVLLEEKKVNTIVGESESYNNYWTFLYTGISAKEMCDNINVKVFGTDTNGNVILLGNLDYTLAEYIETNYAKYESATGKNAELRDLLVDLANYGAYAQEYFGYHTDVQPNDNIPQTHASPLPTTFDTTDEMSGITFYKAPTLGNSIMIDWRFKKSDVASYGEDLTLTTYYKNTDGTDADPYVVSYVDFDTFTQSSTEYWSVRFDKMSAARATDVYLIELKSGDRVIGTMRYSLEKYAYNRYSSDPSTALCKLTQSLIAYSDSADAYFNYVG